MPAHRKTIEAHQLSGAAAKNPKRFTSRTGEPKPKAQVGSAPKHLTPAEKKAWKEIVTSAPKGMLGNSDRLIVEVVSRLLIQFRDGKLLRASEVAQLLNGLGRLGLTPSDRAKLNVDTTPARLDPAFDPLSFLG